MRKLFLLLTVILPQPMKQAVYRHLFGWKIGRRVHLGLSYIDARSVVIGDDTRIGHFNIFRGIERLGIGSKTFIANYNQFFGPGLRGSGSVLILGDGVNFMSRHFVDVTGGVEIGSRCTVGGRDSHIWSHTLRIREGKQVLEVGQVRLAEEVYVGARAILICCDVPAGAMVGAGSVVSKSYPAEPCRLLIAGNPGTIVKRYVNADAEDVNALLISAGRD